MPRALHAVLSIALGGAVFFYAAPPCAAQPFDPQSVGAQQQSNSQSDLTITRNIRRALVKDKSLSTEAHNVTIVTRDGKVTLKGEVVSDAEKQSVTAVATQYAGAGKVENQLTTSAGH